MSVTTPKRFRGRWRIVESALWDQPALDMLEPAHITFEEGGLGSLKMIAVQAGLDCRFAKDFVQFSWIGDDDGLPVNGRGEAGIKDGVLFCNLYFHQGDESSLKAVRDDAPTNGPKKATKRPRARPRAVSSSR
jgi:hypothetical protein